jgi:phosphatidylglycerophosphatase C
VFDLDGTVTRHDTLAPYLLGFMARHPQRVLRMPLGAPALAGFILGRTTHGELKSAWIRAVLGGMPRSVLRAWTTEFVPRVLQRGLHADALRAIAAHRAAGDRLVLLSASVDLYVPDIGHALGFAETLCTQLRWDGEVLNGALATPNRRGAEKARCLEALRARYPQLPVTAYGNAKSDLDHLALAEHGVLVNGSRKALAAANRLHVTPARWS